MRMYAAPIAKLVNLISGAKAIITMTRRLSAVQVALVEPSSLPNSVNTELITIGLNRPC
jgi:hypothetical protein